MLVCSLLLLLLSLIFLVLSIQIYCGNTDLIMQHHQKYVMDKASYGMDFGKALFGFSATLVVSGVLSLSRLLIPIAVIILIAGVLISAILLFCVQKKYNKRQG